LYRIYRLHIDDFIEINHLQFGVFFSA
jgi:hypothetical protein